jgi:hypothetical protein
MPDRTVIHRVDSPPLGSDANRGTTAGDPLTFRLSASSQPTWTTGLGTLSTVTVRAQPLELFRRCHAAAPGITFCNIVGTSAGVSFDISWANRNEITSDAIFAAAADLFDRYVTHGPGLAR